MQASAIHVHVPNMHSIIKFPMQIRVAKVHGHVVVTHPHMST